MWKIKLSNGDTVEQSEDQFLWRKIMNRCKENGLHIVSFTWNGKEIDDRATACFIINDVAGSTVRGLVRARVGLGSFRENGKGRIMWKTQVGNPTAGDYCEVIRPDKAQTYKEISIDRKT
jgi:hypothetical protein